MFNEYAALSFGHLINLFSASSDFDLCQDCIVTKVLISLHFCTPLSLTSSYVVAVTSELCWHPNTTTGS